MPLSWNVLPGHVRGGDLGLGPKSLHLSSPRMAQAVLLYAAGQTLGSDLPPVSGMLRQKLD